LPEASLKKSRKKFLTNQKENWEKV